MRTPQNRPLGAEMHARHLAAQYMGYLIQETQRSVMISLEGFLVVSVRECRLLK